MQIDDNQWMLFHTYIQNAVEFIQSIHPRDRDINNVLEQLQYILDYDTTQKAKHDSTS